MFTHHATDNTKGHYDAKWPNKLQAFKTQRAVYNITFLVFQEEKGHGDEQEENPELRGKYHIQGYLELDHECTFSSLKAAFNKRIHWEKRFGTAEQAEDYCSKEDTQVVDGLKGKFGVRSTVTQGQRTDLKRPLEIIDDDTVLDKKAKLADECGPVVVKYHKGLETYAQWKGKKLEVDRGTKAREVYIIYGDSGCGKSLMAQRLIKDDSYYIPQQNMHGDLSFETYRREKWILLEDYRPGTIGLDALKRMTDTYNCVLPARGSGSSPAALHDGVIITSNHPPSEWVGDTHNGEHLKALQRRAKEIICAKHTGWVYEKSKRSLPPQMPKLEAWARSRGIWQEEEKTSALDRIFLENEIGVEEPQEAQVEEELSQVEQEARYLPLPKRVQIDLTQDSDEE